MRCITTLLVNKLMVVTRTLGIYQSSSAYVANCLRLRGPRDGQEEGKSYTNDYLQGTPTA